jgi:hypothetical protein
MRLYRYVGPKSIADRVAAAPAGVPVRCAQDVAAWARDSGQYLVGGCVTATFVVDAVGQLLIADRCSDHVACAGGRPVRSAGEMTFALGHEVVVVEVSNQSVGYCPEPESWPAVAEALARAGLEAPDGFALACVFRRCRRCGGLNVVKGGAFECEMCGAELSAAYNVQSEDLA